MTLSCSSARLMAIGRRVVPWLVGPTVLLTEGRFLELVPPRPCSGLLDLVSIAAVRARADLTLGAVFGVLHGLAVVIGLAAFAMLVRRATGNMVVAASTAVAIGLGPAFPRVLAPPWEAAAFAVCTGGALAIVSSRNRKAVAPYWRRPIAASVWLVAALVIPEWTVAAALGAGITFVVGAPHLDVSRRYVGGAAMALSCVLLVFAMFALVPRLDGAETPRTAWNALAACSTPVWRSATFAESFGRLLGPFALSLAALGFVAEIQAGWQRCVTLAAVGLAGLALIGVTPANANLTLMPWLVGAWMLAAVGLHQLIAMARSRVTRATAALLLVLFPILQAARLGAEERDDWVLPLGHGAATLGHVVAILNVVPSNAAFAEEDASIDLLMRAAVFGGRRAGKLFAVVPRRRDAIERALKQGPVYAFPRGQADLSQRGFAIEPVARIGRARDESEKTVGGLAEITGTRPCQVIGDEWVDLGNIGAGGRIAMSGDSESAYGPIVLYLGGSMEGEPRPDGWSLRTTRGFRSTDFDRQTEAHANRLEAEARVLELSARPVFSAPYVTRLTLHRTPRAPLTLGILLGASRPLGVAKGEYFDPSISAKLTVCEAPPIKIVSIS